MQISTMLGDRTTSAASGIIVRWSQRASEALLSAGHGLAESIALHWLQKFPQRDPVYGETGAIAPSRCIKSSLADG